MAGSPKEVRLCLSEDCPLYVFRFGRNPRRKGIGHKKTKVHQKNETELGEISKSDHLNKGLSNFCGL